MAHNSNGQVAILYPGDRETRENATPDNNRLASVFRALADRGVLAEPAAYNDEFRAEVREQLMGVNVVLVWMNPIQDGCDRSILDSMLLEVAAAGVFVSAHPRVILKMGTKEVLYRTRQMGWGSDTYLYRDMGQFRHDLPARLASGKARVLKQYRGNGGNGVWKVELAKSASPPRPETIIRVRHAKKGSFEEEVTYVLCEINVSSVAPYPESAPPNIADATLAQIQAAAQNG